MCAVCDWPARTVDVTKKKLSPNLKTYGESARVKPESTRKYFKLVQIFRVHFSLRQGVEKCDTVIEVMAGKVFMLLNQDLEEEIVLKNISRDSSFLGECKQDSILYLSNNSKDIESEESSTKVVRVQSVLEYVLTLYRAYGLSANERSLVLGSEDSILAVQLCLANKNKELRGDFHVEMSAVIEHYRQMVQHFLKTDTTEKVSDNDDIVDIIKRYQDFLKENNVCDFTQVLSAVRLERSQNNDLQTLLCNQTFVILGRPTDSIEEEFLKFLCDGKQCYEFSCEVPLMWNPEENDHLTFKTSETTVEAYLSASSPSTTSSSARQSITELYAEKIYVSYLSLLLNSRSEISLARALNVPDRELNHEAFTRLKKAAGEKRMPMFQTAMSFVMRKRLGGKGYAPDPNNVLNQDIKGLSEFINLMHKLQSVIEETSNPGSAIKKVINILRHTIVTCKDNNLRPSNVESAAEKIKKQADAAITMLEQSQSEASPSRSASSGGSLLGRKTLRAIRQVLDRYASQTPPTKLVTLLSDTFTSQKTPVRIPTLMEQFRSPEEYDKEDSPIQLSLADRMKSKFQKPEKTIGVPRFKSHMSWAPNTDDWTGSNGVFDASQCISSKTVVHPTEGSKGDKARARRLIESINDQENVAVHTAVPDDAEQKASEPNKNCQTKRKRPQEDNPDARDKTKKTKKNNQEPNPLKTKPAKSNAKRKPAPNLQGQKTLTHFFRL